MQRKLILCLGNPDDKYQHTRHNAGWLFGDFLAEQLDCPSASGQSKFHARLTTGHYQDKEVLLAYPTTYMNESGLAAAAIVNFYRLEPSHDLLVVHDDLDIIYGQYKLTRKLPHTHNGLASVKQHLGTDQFTCLRLGVDDRNGQRTIPAIQYVLTNFSPDQLDGWRRELFPRAAKEVLAWL